MNRLAVVVCVHHKPWLAMSTLVTALAQDFRDVDFHFVYNVGSGDEKHADAVGRNSQLSPFDPRVRDVCRLTRPGVFEVEYQNDEALDSGAWYKFIRDRRWTGYDAVLFVGEGTLFARRTLVSGMLELASQAGAHVIASGHEQRRLPRHVFLKYMTREAQPSEDDRLHDAMIARAFDIFCRDPGFRRVLDRWTDDVAVETQNHVPASGPAGALLRRVRDAWARRVAPASSRTIAGELPYRVEYVTRRLAGVGGPHPDEPGVTYVNGIAGAPWRAAEIRHCAGVEFYRVEEPEWFGCATNHFMSRTFLERFTAKLDQYAMWDVLDLRFAGTPLEVIWGFLPAWLGFDKWFTDGFHRPRKDFVTYRREDYPPQMATYINRYYAGDLLVGWHDDFLRINRVSDRMSFLREALPAVYFERHRAGH